MTRPMCSMCVATCSKLREVRLRLNTLAPAPKGSEFGMKNLGDPGPWMDTTANLILIVNRNLADAPGQDTGLARR